jgi:hypothetical protein
VRARVAGSACLERSLFDRSTGIGSLFHRVGMPSLLDGRKRVEVDLWDDIAAVLVGTSVERIPQVECVQPCPGWWLVYSLWDGENCLAAALDYSNEPIEAFKPKHGLNPDGMPGRVGACV